ncbi:MAG: signal peptide peptidase SppA [Treponema bryantii]|nr:signal peptide peptidase SppA [Treponema bryantii]
MTKKVKSGYIILAILVVIAIAATVHSLITTKESVTINFDSNVEYNTNSSQKLSSKGNIAALYIEGTIQQANVDYDQQWLLSTISAIKNDKKNVGIAIFINSPGGAVYQTDDVYLALEDYKTTGRPIYVYQGPMAASGGYYISCAGNKIYANRNTLTGSIGVIAGQSMDLTGLLNKLGIKSETIYAGKNKNMGNYNAPFTPEQKAIMQSIADECYEQFVKIVAKSRNMTYEEAAKLSDGRIYTAQQALDNGLIDAIGSWDLMLDDMADAEFEGTNYKIVTYKKVKKQSFMDIMMSKVSDITKSAAASKTGIPEKVLEDINSPSEYPMYLYK